MTGSAIKTRMAFSDILGLALFVGFCLAIGGFGGAITATSVETWYPTLTKPVFNPPDWVFAPVWTALYIFMGIAAWRVWRRPTSKVRERAFAMFVGQLLLNLLWSVLFFGIRRIDLALIEIVILLVGTVITMSMFWRVDRLAGVLFGPYVAWVTFAMILNASLLALNMG